jgi:hypothetical protein
MHLSERYARHPSECYAQHHRNRSYPIKNCATFSKSVYNFAQLWALLNTLSFIQDSGPLLFPCRAPRPQLYDLF